MDINEGGGKKISHKRHKKHKKEHRRFCWFLFVPFVANLLRSPLGHSYRPPGLSIHNAFCASCGFFPDVQSRGMNWISAILTVVALATAGCSHKGYAAD